MYGTLRIDLDYGLSLDVDYLYHRAYRGYRDSMGVPEEPDEEAGVEIQSAKIGDAEITLTDKQTMEIEEKIWDEIRPSIEECDE